MVTFANLGLNTETGQHGHLIRNRRTDMITTEYLADHALLIHVDGQIDRVLAKEVGLLVFRSFHLGMTTFIMNVKRNSHTDEQTIACLALIGKGLRHKGGIWRIVWPSSSTWERLMRRMTLQQLPPATWN